MIRAEGLTYDYPGTRALDRVDFAAGAGTITALVGPNGAGKSTLLRCLSALEQPQQGRVVIDGEDIHRDPRRSHRKIGYLSDPFGLYSGLTVDQCLRHRAGTHGLSGGAQPAATEAAAARVGASALLGRRTETLSRGQRQRVAIAEAIIHAPPVVLLDEPASGLDPEARSNLSVLLRGLAGDGVTIIVSSHILSELADYSSHVLMLERGRVIAHHPIDGDGAGHVVRVTLAAADPRLATLCAARPDVEVLAIEPAAAHLRIPADPSAQAALLRHLVEAGLPVTGFAPQQADLQHLYLETLRRDRGASA